MNTKKSNYVEWLSEIAISLYCALLIVTTHEEPAFRWSEKLLTYWPSHSGHASGLLTDDGYGKYVTAFILVWVVTVMLFLCVRILVFFPVSKTFLFNITGVIAIAGYPVSSLKHHNGQFPFMWAELVILIACAILWLIKIWQPSTPLRIAMLVFHFSLWGWISKFPATACCIVFWPGWVSSWSSEAGIRARLFLPFLGFSISFLWVKYLQNQIFQNESKS